MASFDIGELTALRHALHRQAELSGREDATAAAVAAFLRAHAPDELITGVGGRGLLALYRGGRPGPCVLVRCELDALPLPESLELDYASVTEGVAHKCGHDGHMAILAGLSAALHEQRPRHGSAALLFQPAEETGRGARRVEGDPRFQALAPDYAFALHNLPGFPLGQVVVREGTFASASKGLVVELEGESSHAAEPHRGRSPALAVAQLIQGLSALPQLATPLEEAAQVTVIHARVGEVAFGTSPGQGVVMATLRTHRRAAMEALERACVELAVGVAAAFGLRHAIRWTEEFPATVNHPDAVRLVAESAAELGLALYRPANPFAWSEDFGHLTTGRTGALFGLGAGEHAPALHQGDYDFPDALLDTGVRLFASLVRHILG